MAKKLRKATTVEKANAPEARIDRIGKAGTTGVMQITGNFKPIFLSKAKADALRKLLSTSVAASFINGEYDSQISELSGDDYYEVGATE